MDQTWGQTRKKIILQEWEYLQVTEIHSNMHILMAWRIEVCWLHKPVTNLIMFIDFIFYNSWAN